MALATIAVCVVAYALIVAGQMNSAAVALVGASVLAALGIMDSAAIFYSPATGIDWDVIFLLLAMMVIVAVLQRTGIFEASAIWATKRAGGSPRRILALLVVITAVTSALLDNVTVVLMVAPVTLMVCEKLAISAVPFLIAEVFASNIGGSATLIGDPPNIVVGSRAGLGFVDFLVNLAPIVAILLVVLIAALPLLFGPLTAPADRLAEVMALDPRAAITDLPLLVRSGAILTLVFAGFIAQPVLHLAPSLAALMGAGLLIAVSRIPASQCVSAVEWETLLFFAGVFVMVGALEKTGTIGHLAHLAGQWAGGDAPSAALSVLAVSAAGSGIIDNVPFAATMAPVVAGLIAQLGSAGAGPMLTRPLWWALTLGTDLGGNLTAVGAGANVVVLGLARRHGIPISFWEFTRKGLIVTTASVALSALYLWLRYYAGTSS